VSISFSRRGGTKFLYRARRGKMEGDMSIWHASQFHINARCTTIMGVSPFAMKCETCLYYACLPYAEKGDTHTRGTSHIRSHALKCLAPRSLSPPSSFGNNNYYAYFIDDYSKFTWIYLLKHKSEVFSKISILSSSS
jgi:hypothetical protein